MNNGRRKLTLELEFPENTTAERLWEVLGDALYRPDGLDTAPISEEEFEGENHWDYDNIDAKWTIEPLI